jgi:poly [ADP-ribose] polymerase
MPHNFGMSRAPVINNIVMIQAKQEMMDNLLQIEVACKIMETDKIKKEVKEKMNPIDAQYDAMKVNMEPLDHDSKEFKMINDYMQNTHASTHSGYRLVLEDVYKVDREGEKNRYKKYSKLHNRQLLWHGSRKTNFVGILTNGLRIAPKEAPVSFEWLSLAHLPVLIPNRSPATCSEKAFTSPTCARSLPTTASPANLIQLA